MSYEKHMNSKSRRSIILAGIIFSILATVFIVFGVTGLLSQGKDMGKVFEDSLEKGNCYEGEIKYASQNVYIMKHTINFIPVAYEYYYVITNYDASSMVVVRAPKKWGDNFNEDTGESLKKIVAKGNVKKCSYKVKSGMEEIRSRWMLDSYGTKFDSGYYVDLLQTRNSILQLVLGIGILLFMALCVFKYVFLEQTKLGVIFGRLSIVVAMIDCCLALHVINML